MCGPLALSARTATLRDMTQGSEGQVVLDAPTDISPIASADLPGPEADDALPLLWHSNAPWVGSGYGSQSCLFGPRIGAMDEYNLAFSAFWGLKGGRIGWVAPDGQPFTVYSGFRDPHGNEVISAHFKDWGKGRGMVIVLSDPWVMRPEVMAPLPTVAWIPIDHEPLIPPTDIWLRKSQAVPVAMSRWGQEVMRAKGHDPLYVPHGIDANIFHPVPRDIPRKQLRWSSDQFVVGIVAANTGIPSRKCWPEMIRAFKIFRERHDDAILYIHSEMEPGARNGVDITLLCETENVYPLVSDQYRYCTGRYTPRNVSGLYNAFDVLMNGAAGEGFGIPMLEANACGTPVICTDFSASPEVAPAEVGNWNVPGQEFWTNFNSWQVRPNIEALVDALEQAYAMTAEEREAQRISVAHHALSNYEADYITEKYWKPVLLEAQLRLQFRSRKRV